MDQLDPSRVHVELSKDKELAKGGFSLVYHGELDGRPVAIKMARADEDELKGKSLFCTDCTMAMWFSFMALVPGPASCWKCLNCVVAVLWMGS